MRSLRPTAPAIVVTICLLLLTSAAALATSRAIDRREDQLLEERAEQAATALDRRTDAYIQKLIGLRGLFAGEADGIPTPRSYDSFIRSQDVQRRFPELQTLTFVQEVTDDERRPFLRRMRSETAASGLNYPPIAIRPPGRRERMGVIAYVYPVERNRTAVGADLLVDPVRRGAINRGRDTARVVSPAPVRLVQDRGALSLVFFLPVFAGPDQMPPARERERRFIGSVATAVRLEALTRGLTVESDDEIRLYDLGYEGARPLRRLIHDTRPNTGADARRSRELPLRFAGRRWIITYASDDALVGDIERAVPWLIAILGALVSLLTGVTVQAATSGRRQALEDLEESRNELARSNEELERFAFLASHDLQQPLRTVSGFLQLLERQQGEKLDERGQLYVDQALKGIKQMSQLITDLLAYSRVSREDRPLEPVPLEDAWDEAVAQLKATIDETDASVRRGPLPTVIGDRGQMTQLFANLIANGVRYRSQETPSIRADAIRVNGGWEISVQDNGIGIDPRDHERIFEMFRRLHADEEIEGTGIGLALVKRIAERSGGDVHVESERGAGSRFVLHLPAQEVQRGR